jgi:hypothetical protein
MLLFGPRELLQEARVLLEGDRTGAAFLEGLGLLGRKRERVVGKGLRAGP